MDNWSIDRSIIENAIREAPVKNNAENLSKSPILANLIPNNISECALYSGKKIGDVCMSNAAVHAIGNIIGVQGTDKNIIDSAKDKLNCTNEKCVLEKLTNELGHDMVKKEINLHLKVKGPTDTKLLNNIHIDNTLKQWGIRFLDFYPFNFNMKNYASYSWRNGYVVKEPDSLASILFSDLYNGVVDGRQYRCCACVINSDTYQGEGKHWMALFADARSNTRFTVEFFNSSGNPPVPEWVNWLVKTKSDMELLTMRQKIDTKVEILNVTKMRHQKSKSECGLYSLFYIWARLHKIPPEYFMKNLIPDQLMFEFRYHLFDDPTRKTIRNFNWNEYKNTVKIEWE